MIHLACTSMIIAFGIFVLFLSVLPVKTETQPRTRLLGTLRSPRSDSLLIKSKRPECEVKLEQVDIQISPPGSRKKLFYNRLAFSARGVGDKACECCIKTFICIDIPCHMPVTSLALRFDY